MQGLYGLNPYRVPTRAVLGDPVYGLANWHGLRSPYGPLFTSAFAVLAHLPVAVELWTWKGVVFASSMATVTLTAAIARRLGRDPARAAALLGLSPILLLAEVGGEHQDAPALLCVVAAAWCLVRARDMPAERWPDAAAGALLVTAAAIKPSLAIVAPVVVAGAQRRLWALAGLGAAAAVAGLADLVAFGGATPDLATQGALVMPLSVPNLLGLAAGHGGADAAMRAVARDALAAVAVLAAIPVALRRDRTPAALAAVLVAAVLALPWVMPWYLVWGLPFLALARRPAWALVAVALAAWLTLGGLPQETAVLHWLGYFPTRHATGVANHLTLERLVR
jgi:4-amino-4-deoxy-L-arabinose transferase-like glycosyltransferase